MVKVFRFRCDDSNDVSILMKVWAKQNVTRPRGTRFSKKYFNRVVKTRDCSRNCSVQSRTLRAIKLEKKMTLPHFDKNDHSKDFQITYPTEI